MTSPSTRRAGWADRPLADLASLTMGQSPSSEHYNSSGNGVPLIQGKADIKDRRTTARTWTTLAPKRGEAADLVLTVRAPVGSVAVAHSDICLGRGVCGVKPKGDAGFLYQALIFAEDRWNRLEQGSTFTATNRRQVYDFSVLVPIDLCEQRAIADVLSDVDSLLASLDALIAKKRGVKKATLRQLLTGRTRIPGYRDEWSSVQLGDIARIASGGTPSTQNAAYWNGDIPWCVPTDITRDSGKYLRRTARTITESGLSNSGANLLPAGSLLLCSRATIGEIKISLTPTCTNQGFKSLICGERVLNEFCYYLILTLRPRLLERASGSTFLEISRNGIASIEVRLPEIDEQRAIASVLSDIDAEIEALERWRDKTRALKQGVMQQLLTGQIRLVEPEASAKGARA